MTGRVRLGAIVIVLGIFLVLRAADIWPFNTSLSTVFFLGVGGVMLLGRAREKRYRELFLPIVLVVVGTIFLLRDIGLVSGLLGFWPIVLIGLGAYLIIGSLGRSEQSHSVDL